MTTWFSKWRIKINVDKTQAIVFTKRRPRDIPQIIMNNRQIEYADKTKYLGILLDKKLTFLDHIKYVRAKTASRLTRLYPILTTQEFTIRQKVTIYKALIRPTLTYASPAWGFALTSYMQLLQTIQNRAARIITGADTQTRITQLHEIT